MKQIQNCHFAAPTQVRALGAQADHVARRLAWGACFLFPLSGLRWDMGCGQACGAGPWVPSLWPPRLQAPRAHQAPSPWNPQEPPCHLQLLHTLPLGLGAQPGDHHLLEALPRPSGDGDSPAQLHGHQAPREGGREHRPARLTAVAQGWAPGPYTRRPLSAPPCPEHREQAGPRPSPNAGPGTPGHCRGACRRPIFTPTPHSPHTGLRELFVYLFKTNICALCTGPAPGWVGEQGAKLGGSAMAAEGGKEGSGSHLASGPASPFLLPSPLP